MRFSLLGRALLTLALLFAVTSVARAEAVDPSGFLLLTKPSKACTNFDHLMLHKENGKWTGWVQLNTQDKLRYNFKSISIQGTNFRFVTFPDKNNVSYSFIGHFLQKGVYATTQPVGHVLDGHLSSWNGRNLNVDDHVTLTYTVGD